MGLGEILAGLRAELVALDRELKCEIPRKIQAARELGDLRESGEYEAIKDRQGFVQARINYIKQRIAAISSINPNTIPKGRVGFGSTVHLRNLDNGEVKVYKLVLPEEVNASLGFLSLASPVGRSLMGCQEGNEVVVQTPSGRKRYEVIKVVTIHEEA